LKHLPGGKAPILIAIVALGAVGAGIVASGAVGWLSKTSGHVSTASCIIKPAPVSIADAKPHLNFAVFALTNDPNAVLLSSQYAQGCDSAKGLELDYRINGYFVELVEATAPPPGSPLVVVKPGAKTQTGWTTANMDGYSIAVDLTAGGKGMPGGIAEAVWTKNATLLTLTPGSAAPGGRQTPFPQQVLLEILSHLTAF
jgi:hypothetical protein